MKEAEILINIIENSFHLRKVVEALYEFKIEDCYIGAGAIVQTVWNISTNRLVDYGIDDIDIVYYNSQDIEEKHEKKIVEYLNQELREYFLWLDAKNEGRVYLWYKDKSEYKLES